MCKLNPSVRVAQEDLLKRLERVEPGLTNRDIARVCKVDATLVSKWTSAGEDGREIPRSALLRMANAWGWDVVFSDDAREAGWNVSRLAATPSTPESAGARAGRALSLLLAELSNAGAPESPGGHKYAPEEMAILLPLARTALPVIEAFLASSPDGQVPLTAHDGGRR
jgi:hypothetical protein